MPTNVDIKGSNWIIDEPVINIATNYSSDIAEQYKKELSKNFGQVKSIREFKNLSSMNRFLKSDLKILKFYKEQSNFDYLIETEVKSVKSDLPTFQLYPEKGLSDEMYIRLIVYDLNNMLLVYDREFRFHQSFEGGNDIALSKKKEKFYTVAINTAIKEFGKKYNWEFK
jgi:hypothetical protein